MRATTLESCKKRKGFLFDHALQNINEKYAAVELAGMISMSSFQFHSVSKGIVGEAGKNYFRSLRLERSANKLLATDK